MSNPSSNHSNQYAAVACNKPTRPCGQTGTAPFFFHYHPRLGSGSIAFPFQVFIVSISCIAMAKTTKLLMSPAPGTEVKPAYVYDDAQKEKLHALREVCLRRLLSPPSFSLLKPPPLISYSLFFYRFSMPTHFAYPTMTPMRHGSAAGLIGQTPSHVTCVLPSGSSMMHGSESRAPSNGAASTSQNSSHQTRSRSRLRQERCECAPTFLSLPACPHD